MTFFPHPPQEKERKHALSILKKLGIRHTEKRENLLALIYGDGSHHIHFTIDDLISHTKQYHIAISLATLYNTLKVLVDKGYLHEITLPMGGRLFDTNTSSHQHFYNLDTHEITDIPHSLSFEPLINIPQNTTISDIQVTICLKNT